MIIAFDVDFKVKRFLALDKALDIQATIKMKEKDNRQNKSIEEKMPKQFGTFGKITTITDDELINLILESNLSEENHDLVTSFAGAY